ncbi:MAG: YcjF family protein [Bacilli bacterium]|nr:YcjF family protein [Bacilli bacterium]
MANQNQKNKENKISLDEYINKYTQPKNFKEIKLFFVLLVTAIGIVIVFMMFSFVEKLFTIHKVAGYIGVSISILIFLFLYIVPIVKITTSKHFITHVNRENAKAAQKHNARLREEIADKMIDLSISTNGNGWYSDAKITPIAVARAKKDSKSLKAALTDIYNTDIKKASRKMIRDISFQVGLTTTISQSERVDSLIVTVSEINLIKKLVFLYGYRPNDAQMLKIYKNVITNALLAYGIQSATSSIAGGIGKLIGGAAKEIPFISTVIGSVTDGTINATLTTIIGFQTIRYLKREYKLQDILDGVEIEDSEEEERALITEIKKDISSASKKKKALMQS